MSFSKTNLLPRSAGNTQEAVAPSQHDYKIVYRDVKNQMNQTNKKIHKTSLARCTNGSKSFGHTFCITWFWMALGKVNSMKLSVQALGI